MGGGQLFSPYAAGGERDGGVQRGLHASHLNRDSQKARWGKLRHGGWTQGGGDIEGGAGRHTLT